MNPSNKIFISDNIEHKYNIIQQSKIINLNDKDLYFNDNIKITQKIIDINKEYQNKNNISLYYKNINL